MKASTKVAPRVNNLLYGITKYVYVTEPVKIDHVSATNYTNYFFANIFHSEYSVSFP